VRGNVACRLNLDGYDWPQWSHLDNSRHAMHGGCMTANFKKTIATATAKIADGETKAFKARFEAIEAILQGATPMPC